MSTNPGSTLEAMEEESEGPDPLLEVEPDPPLLKPPLAPLPNGFVTEPEPEPEEPEPAEPEEPVDPLAVACDGFCQAAWPMPTPPAKRTTAAPKAPTILAVR
jgi:hypothetical protein